MGVAAAGGAVAGAAAPAAAAAVAPKPAAPAAKRGPLSQVKQTFGVVVSYLRELPDMMSASEADLSREFA